VQEVAAYSTLAMTVGLVVARPRVGSLPRLPPAVAAWGGVLVLALFGILGVQAVGATALDVWRSFVAITAIMVMTAVALELGVLSALAARVEQGAPTTRALFRRVFILGSLTAAMLNNDAAILLLTPLVVTLARRRFPERIDVVVMFAFAVFMAAGVAPFFVSNPMNMVVADHSGIGFNAYAARMVPIAVAGWILAYHILAWLFRRQLAVELGGTPAIREPMGRAQWAMVGILAAALIGYSLVGYLGGPVWLVAVTGAVLSLALARRSGGANPVQVVSGGVSWQTLLFLLGVLVLATGLAHVGMVDRLADAYAGADTPRIGVISALGSAVIDNHPMAYMNMLALEGHHHSSVLAALIGGDLGPRLLPMGSLAGLLWMESLRRQGIIVTTGRFVRIGATIAAPTIAVSLAILALY